jgi:hypothetical protein
VSIKRKNISSIHFLKSKKKFPPGKGQQSSITEFSTAYLITIHLISLTILQSEKNRLSYFLKKRKKKLEFSWARRRLRRLFLSVSRVVCVCVHLSAGATVWMMMMMMRRSGAFSSDFRATPKRNKSLKSKLLLLLPCVMQIA